MEDPQPNPTSEDVSLNPPTRQPMLLWIGLIVAAFALGLGTGYFVWARPLQDQLASAERRAAVIEATVEASGTAVAAENAAQAEAAIPEEVKRYDVPEDDDPAFGSSSAPITIIEFSDYECPFCRRWHQEVWPQIQAKYGDKVRLVYRDFPLYNIHQNAGPAALAANCAGEQDRYWEFNERLFNTEELGPAVYTNFAQEIKLDLDSFQQCIDEGRYNQEVEADYNYASELGVRSTPTFFINGLAVVGAQPFEVFDQVINMELSGKIPK